MMWFVVHSLYTHDIIFVHSTAVLIEKVKKNLVDKYIEAFSSWIVSIFLSRAGKDEKKTA